MRAVPLCCSKRAGSFRGLPPLHHQRMPRLCTWGYGRGSRGNSLSRPVSCDCGSQIVSVPDFERCQSGDLCLRFRAYHVCWDASATGSASSVGLFICIWRSSEYTLYMCATNDHARRTDGKSEVCVIFHREIFRLLIVYVLARESCLDLSLHSMRRKSSC